MTRKRNAYRLLVRRPEGKRLVGRPRRTFVVNIKIGLGETDRSGVGYIALVHDRCRLRAV
jgi:hypothetical protein